MVPHLKGWLIQPLISYRFVVDDGLIHQLCFFGHWLTLNVACARTGATFFHFAIFGKIQNASVNFFKIEKKMTKSSTSSSTVQGQPVAKKTKLVHRTIIYDETKANQWLDEPPLEIWDHHIIPLLGLRDLALSRPVCTFFEAYWQEKFQGNVIPLRVGNDVSTIEDVMGVVEILSIRREYTKASPFVVLLGKGDHEVTSSWTNPHGTLHQNVLGITRSNVTFLGQGIGETRILGGIAFHNVQNITLKQLTVTNTNGDGIAMYGAVVELVDAAVVHCRDTGIFVRDNASTPSQLVATRCEMSNNGGSGLSISNNNRNISHNVCLKNFISHYNSRHGIWISGNGVVSVHGDASAIRSNGSCGISASFAAKVIIHLPSHHNTIYNNPNGDRHAIMGGTITNVEDEEEDN